MRRVEQSLSLIIDACRNPAFRSRRIIAEGLTDLKAITNSSAINKKGMSLSAPPSPTVQWQFQIRLFVGLIGD
jgi:hypothetical protein